ncbi:MAG TPA: hypothetical protein VK539_32780 [Myxococcaceae bacterium]|nr:hypothetical protein [Myxococcaceae bacterium]
MAGLVYGIRHRLNNPLSYLRPLVDLAKHDLEGLLQELGKGSADPARLESVMREVVEALSDGQLAVKRLTQIMADLACFPRFDAPFGTLADVKRAIESGLGTDPGFLRMKAQLIKQLEDVPPVRGSQQHVDYVFHSLLSIVAGAIPEGAPVESRLEVRLRQEGQWVVAEIEATLVGPPQFPVYSSWFSVEWDFCHAIIVVFGGELRQDESCFRVRLPVA